MVSYRTIAEYKAWVQLNDGLDDVTIDGALTAASTGIDNFCRTHFWKTVAGTARVFDTCHVRWLHINDAVAITEVATDTDGDGIYETVWTAADFQVLPLNPAAGPEVLPFMDISAIGDLTFPRPTRRLGLVRVTGTWGWPAVPPAVLESTLLLTNRLIKRRGSPEGIAGSEFGPVHISRREDPDVVNLLDRSPYKTNRRVGGWAFA